MEDKKVFFCENCNKQLKFEEVIRILIRKDIKENCYEKILCESCFKEELNREEDNFYSIER